jgi:hypothetical protein
MDQLGSDRPASPSHQSRGDSPPTVHSEDSPSNLERHRASSQPVDVTIVHGYKARFLDACIPNEFVAEYVRSAGDRMIGFAGIDPSDPKAALDDIRLAQKDLNMKGLSVAPAAQDYHPSNSHAFEVYEAAADANLPVMFHRGLHLASPSKLEYARPVLLDAVAREFPKLRIIVAHMGYPWIDETLALIAKHEHVYTETSWLPRLTWPAYQALRSAHQWGLTPKILFGSGFPHTTPTEAIDTLYAVKRMVLGTDLPGIPRESVRGIIEADSLKMLGLQTPAKLKSPTSKSMVLKESEEDVAV